MNKLTLIEQVATSIFLRNTKIEMSTRFTQDELDAAVERIAISAINQARYFVDLLEQEMMEDAPPVAGPGVSCDLPHQEYLDEASPTPATAAKIVIKKK